MGTDRIGVIHIAKGKYQEWLTPDGLTRIEGWAREGLTDAQIAVKMGVNVSTLYKYQNEHNEITEALKRGKAPVDIEVENMLLKRAMGYTYTETTEEVYTYDEIDPKTGKPKVKEKHVKRVTKEIPPDTTAQIFWLKNRRPDLWRDRHENDVSIKNVNFDALNAAFEGIEDDDP